MDVEARATGQHQLKKEGEIFQLKMEIDFKES
jgi:hypothetical protein